MGGSEKRPSIRPGRSLAALTAVLAVLLLFCPSGRSEAQANPFFDSPAPAAPSVSVPTPRLQALIGAQRMIREVLAEAVDSSARGGEGVPALLALAFAYGLLHALGPGHRKVALAAYFLARPARPLEGVAAGASVALLHAAAALAIIYGLYYLFRATVTTTFASVSSILELASYTAILLLGLILLALAARGIVREMRNGGGGNGSDRLERGVVGQGERRTLTAIILSSGAVPCPGTALILIFCLSQNLPWIGILAALTMSVGMAVVTVGVSLAAIFGKRGLLSALPRGSRLGSLFHHGLEIGGAVLIVVFGLFMLSPYLVGLFARG
jgi:ABC-type nickel/cobalt efflux system permease component RcnA